MTAKTTPSLPRTAALVGPFGSGKTTLLDALLHRSGAIARQGRVKDGTTVGDGSPEARARWMSVELSVAATEYLGETWTFLDCPGSVEFQQDCQNALAVADIAVVVCEPDPARAVMVAPLLKRLDELAIPHLLFINKIETAGARLRETLDALQAVSDRPLVLREIPIREDEKVVGFVDLVSERAYRYTPGQPSELIRVPDALLDEHRQARQGLLEHLADFDDHLLEELLEEVVPPRDEVYEGLARDLGGDLIVPVLFGSAESGAGVTRLLKALRHDAPSPRATAQRLGLEINGGGAAGRVFKTLHAPHTGKMSFVRILAGELADGQDLAGNRISGLYVYPGGVATKTARVGIGQVAGLGRLDSLATGDALGRCSGTAPWPTPLPPLFGLALTTEKKGDEVKLSGAMAKLVEEDPSYRLEQSAQSSDLVLWGQGEIHLQVAADRLRNRFNLQVVTRKPSVPYQETIRKPVSVHGRHKKQSGGHGQFGDVHLDIAPLPRGTGFQFIDRIVGGVIPRQYIPAVEEGVREFLARGPLGFPVVDIAVALTAGTYHAVDSSDMAFKTAARIAMTEGLPQCEPVLLEPILKVEISVPSDYTSKAQRIIAGRRGQILGYDARPGWTGWDSVSAFLPQAEMGDLIVELRSLTMGVGTFHHQFDHLQDLTGRVADKVIEARRQDS
jgi:elongation factor G